MRGCTLRALLFGAGLIAAVALPSTALAQADDRPPSTRAIGEEYHIEVGGAIWRPGLFGLIASEQFGIVGTQIDFVSDLGFKKTQFMDGRLVLRPSKKSKFRFQYTPVSYTADSTLKRQIIFNGILYPVNVPIKSTFDWKVWRVGYEFDFFYTDRGYVGFLIEGRYTQMSASLKSPINDEATVAKAPLPAFGLVGRAYPLKNISITAEVSGFQLPDIDENYQANYVDIDIYGTMNFSRHLGVQVGWRRMNTFLRVKTDQGDFRFNGLWFGGALRY